MLEEPAEELLPDEDVAAVHRTVFGYFSPREPRGLRQGFVPQDGLTHTSSGHRPG
jgi:hypothetical protein